MTALEKALGRPRAPLLRAAADRVACIVRGGGQDCDLSRQTRRPQGRGGQLPPVIAAGARAGRAYAGFLASGEKRGRELWVCEQRRDGRWGGGGAAAAEFVGD